MFQSGTEGRFLKVSQNGSISVRETINSFPSGRRAAKAALGAAELQALRDFLNSGDIRGLQDSYGDYELVLDYHASMEIEMAANEKTKRIALHGLSFGGTHNSKIYPVPIHDLVCKIYGLEIRVGIPYRPTVQIDPDGHKSDDTWCDAGSLDLIPKTAP
jgi:hypothetical protein